MSLRTKWTGLKEVLAFDNRALLILTKLLFPRERLHIYRYRGMQFLTDHDAGDANGAREVLTSPMYRDLLPELDLDGPINVLDLGGNNGGFPLLLKANGFEIRKVVSVELNPRTFVRLHFNLHRNLLGEVHALNAAVCDNNEKMSIGLSRGAVSDNIYVTPSDSDAVVDIDGYTFDRLYDRHFSDEPVDVCKIDIEGAEFDVFRGNDHERLRHCRYVIMEIHEGEGRNANELIEKLEDLDFSRHPTKPGADPTVHLFSNGSLT